MIINKSKIRKFENVEKKLSILKEIQIQNHSNNKIIEDNVLIDESFFQVKSITYKAIFINNKKKESTK